ncbi:MULTISPECIES: hypothetical protein [unclassified Lentimonas]|uniref:hypothetical protein n=1 Tax=unclassified Lentimonas TaxID=2630993 RepID=UPI0013228F19|nr:MULTISPECIES: hypothetical protein [unclassified Lentimonas]CAA6676258.1 Unannotated [Lentimonas sp. CC4]CAA6683855.1 Unannotated [Lentimonas sp. CC6]CAA7077749.1 Unannotated [Lentimonas sp. CC4]CAA7169683.1 Unannotated [Lentimonas sp. CC21]CAA7179504.1 Unannotated [Lentimonas sp. CC8]
MSPNESSAHKQRLHRLDPTFYKDKAYVHWTFTTHKRRTGWLTDSFYQSFQTQFAHLLVRYHQCCPVYCFMPDHAHFLFVGLNHRSNQLALLQQLTRQWNELIQPYELSRQAYDNVLRERDRQQSAFADLVGYILRKPVRKNLVEHWQDWPYSGCSLPGYRTLDPRKDYFWENFWKGYREQAD